MEHANDVGERVCTLDTNSTGTKAATFVTAEEAPNSIVNVDIGAISSTGEANGTGTKGKLLAGLWQPGRAAGIDVPTAWEPQRRGFALLDIQMLIAHMARLEEGKIPRAECLRRLRDVHSLNAQQLQRPYSRARLSASTISSQKAIKASR